MIVFLPTIMHTGTFLMLTEVFKGYQHVGIKHKNPAPNSIIHCHTTNSLYYEIDSAIDAYPIVVPMRHPARVWESFKRRNTALNDRIFREQFACLSDLCKGRKVFFVHVDQPELRDAELADINKELGLSLKTDWPEVNVVGNTNKLELTKDMIDEVPEWIMRFYQSTYLSKFGAWRGAA